MRGAPSLVLNNLSPNMEYDGFAVDDWVRLGRHDEIDGSDNWVDEMDKYVDCIARVASLEGKGLV